MGSSGESHSSPEPLFLNFFPLPQSASTSQRKELITQYGKQDQNQSHHTGNEGAL